VLAANIATLRRSGADGERVCLPAWTAGPTRRQRERSERIRRVTKRVRKSRASERFAQERSVTNEKLILPVWTARPTTRTAFAGPQVCPDTFDVLLPGLRFLHRLHPADPFVARERSDVFPLRKGGRVVAQFFSEICRKRMHGAGRDSLAARRWRWMVSCSFRH
jgi:hypothetical protein